MLEYIWFFVLMTTSIVLAVKGARTADFSDPELPTHGLCCVSLSYLTASLAVALSWSRTGEVLMGYLLTHLPEVGSWINHFTAGMIAAIAALSCAVVIPTLVIGVTPRRRDTIPRGKQRESVLRDSCIILASIVLYALWVSAALVIFCG